MLSDEEKREYEELKSLLYTGTISQYGKRKLIDIIEKQSKEIEELQELSISVRAVNQIDKMQKEIEELKEDNKRVKFLYDDACKCLLNSVDKDKIKAKIEYKKDKLRQIQNSNDRYRIMCLQVEIDILQSLLEKE